MAFDYTRSQATADRLINNFGQAATLVKTTASTTKPYDPSSGIETKTSTAITVAVLDYFNSEIDGTLIRRDDKKIYMSALGLTVVPEVKDNIVVGGVVHSVVNINHINPGGVIVAYVLQARA